MSVAPQQGRQMADGRARSRVLDLVRTRQLNQQMLVQVPDILAPQSVVGRHQSPTQPQCDREERKVSTSLAVREVNTVEDGRQRGCLAG